MAENAHRGTPVLFLVFLLVLKKIRKQLFSIHAGCSVLFDSAQGTIIFKPLGSRQVAFLWAAFALSLARQQPQASGLVHGLAFAVHGQLGVQVFNVGLHSVHTDAAQVRNLQVREASGDQL